MNDFTTARVNLGRAGNSLPTRELLDFQLAHARARDAVHFPLDAASFALPLPTIRVQSAAKDRAEYLRRPDRGRSLNPQSQTDLAQIKGPYDIVFVIADGLSALAVHRHATDLLTQLIPQLTNWNIAPIVIVEQGRVAIADEIGHLLHAQISVILIGERPGLTTPDSLGIYLTFSPRPGRTDAERNCISNIHSAGLTTGVAAKLLLLLIEQARAHQLSGVRLSSQIRDYFPVI